MYSERQVQVSAGEGMVLGGTLTVPAQATGVVLFAHGSGSGRWSPRSWRIARCFQSAGFATLLMGLLSQEEEAEQQTQHLHFNVGLLAGRMTRAAKWLRHAPETAGLPVGYFGSSTGAAVALASAALSSESVGAVVSHGGRLDLARFALRRLRTPTLLVVGGQDVRVLKLNRLALAEMHADTRLEVIPEPAHHPEEHGPLERCAELSIGWFRRHLEVDLCPIPER